MPFNSTRLEESWNLLEHHVEDIKDPCVGRASNPKEAGCKWLDAMLCAPMKNAGPSRVNPQFPVTIQPDEAILLIRLRSRQTVVFAVLIRASGARQAWEVHRNGGPLVQPEEFTVAPAKSKYFGRGEKYLPFFTVLKSAGVGSDRVTIESSFVADRSLFLDLIKEVKNRNGFAGIADVWRALVHADS